MAGPRKAGTAPWYCKNCEDGFAFVVPVGARDNPFSFSFSCMLKILRCVAFSYGSH
jgi:hypothetical protein